MDIRERLQRVTLPQEPTTSSPAERRQDPPLEEIVGGQWVSLPMGRCLVTEQEYDLTYEHGGLPLGALLEVPPAVWGRYLREPGEGFDPARAVFLDIETTALMRGASTYAFLVGLGLFETERFVLRQLFMPDYDDEGALLELLGQALDGRQGLVSFNGRTFDWPILEARYSMAQRAQPWPEGLPHLDLLPLSRRLWNQVLPSCALGALETDVLGTQRLSEDVPGYQVPPIYQDYLREGLTWPLQGVFSHNAMDVLSLVPLAARIGRTLNQDEPLAELLDPVALGKLFEQQGRDAEAERMYAAAAQAAPDSETASRAWERLSMLMKRQRRYAEAIALWRGLLGQDTVSPYLELAKALEHHERDFPAAHAVVSEAFGWLAGHEAQLPRYKVRALRAELQHRRERLERKMGSRH